MYEFKMKGTCATALRFDVRDGKISGLSFENGCDGNLRALSRLTEGMPASEVADRLRGLGCDRKATSCADQLARAIDGALAEGESAETGLP